MFNGLILAGVMCLGFMGMLYSVSLLFVALNQYKNNWRASVVKLLMANYLLTISAFILCYMFMHTW